MRVWTYPEETMEEFGARRWQVEWHTVRPGVDTSPNASYDFDWDNDLVCHIANYKTEAAAKKAAKRVAPLSAFGVATIEEQVVDWFVEEDRVAEWIGRGRIEEIAS